jgi:hypothetical protein
MALYSLTEEQRQVVALALVELKLRRPGWGEFLDAITDGILECHAMRLELERLHAGEGAPCPHQTREASRTMPRPETIAGPAGREHGASIAAPRTPESTA